MANSTVSGTLVCPVECIIDDPGVKVKVNGKEVQMPVTLHPGDVLTMEPLTPPTQEEWLFWGDTSAASPDTEDAWDDEDDYGYGDYDDEDDYVPEDEDDGTLYDKLVKQWSFPAIDRCPTCNAGKPRGGDCLQGCAPEGMVKCPWREPGKEHLRCPACKGRGFIEELT